MYCGMYFPEANWLSHSILCLLMKEINLLYISFSKIILKMESREMGR